MTTINEVISKNLKLSLEESDNELLREIQENLQLLGFYNTKIDGIYGKESSNAWATFKMMYSQKDLHLVGAGSLRLLIEKVKNLSKNPPSLVPSRAIDLIKEFEGYYDYAYPDDIHGWNVPTIGYGTIKYPDGSKVAKGDTCNKSQAIEWLMWEVNKLCTPALSQIPNWGKMNSNQKSALYSFAYNLGADFYHGSGFQSISDLIDSPEKWKDKEFVISTFSKYRNPGSAAEEGLKRRRVAEAYLFLQSMY